MLTATLGGLIKDFRIKKRLSQQEVSLRIGWKDTSRLSKIEQGRVGKPARETIDKVTHALDLTEQEKGEFLLAGGYLPTEDEIKKAADDTQMIVGKFAVKLIVHPKDSKKMLKFYLFAVPVPEDPRFEIEILVPMDKATFDIIISNSIVVIFKRNGNTSCLRDRER